MQLPNLPTDNLYKFIALSGIAIFITSSYMVYTIEIKQSDLWRMHYFESLGIQKETLRIQGEIKQLNNLYKKGKETKKSLDRLQQRFSEIRSDTKKNDALVVKSYLEKDNLTLLEERTNNLFYYCLSGVLLGTLMSICGFYLWYVRLQKPLDEQLKNQKL